MEEDAGPPAPPPPPKPTSPPPTAEGGFEFGLPRKKAFAACTTKHVWKRHGEHWSCTKPLEDMGFGTSPVLNFCDDVLCGVGMVVTVAESDWESWNKAFSAIRSRLVERHGQPTTSEEQIPPECRNEQFVECLKAGKASAEATWKWDEGHVVSIRMSKKKSGEGPAAIRFVSIRRAPVSSAAPGAPN